MNILESLAAALGLATLAGLNLYLTVFVTGLAIHLKWVVLPASLQHLDVLGDPWIVAVAGVLYFLEFFADKFPWIDSANDAVHTVIRPIGAALLAALALGEAHPSVQVIAALIGGGVALTAHAAKAGTRLIANTSPEPVSNIGLSLGEDVLVLGGLGALALHPLIAAGVLLALLIGVWLILPKLWRSIRATIWLAWRKLNEPPIGAEKNHLLGRLPGNCELLIRRAHATSEEISLALPCLSGGGPRLPRNLFGWLVRFTGGKLFFVAPKWVNSVVVEIPLTAETAVVRESRFLAERLTLMTGKSLSHVFLFDRGGRLQADRLADALRPRPEVEEEDEEVSSELEIVPSEEEKVDEEVKNDPSESGKPLPPFSGSR